MWARTLENRSLSRCLFFFFNDTATTEIYTLSLHDALPISYALQRKSTNASASLSLVWPLYLGGLSDAVRSGLDAATDEALADAASSSHALHSLLVQRYFGAQLAERAARLRERALEGVRMH